MLIFFEANELQNEEHCFL